MIRFTSAQAEYFAENFSAVAYRSDEGASGFQATVFRADTTGELTLAIRGTEEPAERAPGRCTTFR